ncbi:hypothetical protein E3O62_08125 [Cryobacterium sp. TMT2-15-1]|uniref:hypothetical protein n=1 Tax=Cryobacterium sp. TMT2-15-1 TaxID=1259246 RepID=UPI00106B5B67|nr:hypothetical protein [Cryobacterium sp. TMT2-15-1]TFC60178.1 hypothetical protein E3O62_08125 [Cryobacterium sp. TMT2-15-1]
MSIRQPVKVVTPAVLAEAHADRVTPTGALVRLNVTAAVLFVTVLPPASCTVTTGWVKKAL